MPGHDHEPRAARGRHPPAWMARWDRARRGVLGFGAFLVVAALVAALGARDAGALHTALSVGWLGLLLMIASVWRPSRLRRHEGWVSDLRPPMDDADAFEPYAVARCSCGWADESCATVGEAFDQARGHSESVDPVVERPLG